jgi:hypothetical protein
MRGRMRQWLTGTAVLLLLFGFAGESGAGFQNILVAIDEPPPGILGAAVTVRVTTQLDGAPLPNRDAWVVVERPGPLPGQWTWTDWAIRTNRRGEAKLTVPLFTFDRPGTWLVHAFLLTPLPDGTYDGDVLTFPVAAP